MLKRMTQKEVFARDDIHVFEYAVNDLGIRIMEFGSLFLLVLAAMIYPLTHFEPQFWMIAPIVLLVAAVGLYIAARYWRSYAKKAVLAYDDEFLFVGNDPKAVACIPWEIVDVHNTGLAKPKSGADLKMCFDGEKVRLRLFTTVVCIPQFETVLYTILNHVNENQKKGKA